MPRFLSFAVVLTLLFASGCTYFRLPILQGNIVDYDKAEQLELGMTPRQVEFLLGTPLIQDSFGSKRWDYVVYYRSPDAKVLQKNLSVYFENDAVSRIEGREELLADWRKQKAVISKAKEILETPHPGQFPADASKVSTNPNNPDEPHPVLPPPAEENPGVEPVIEPSEPAASPEDESSVPAPPEPAASSQPSQPATQEAPTESSNKREASSPSSEADYPRDMSTIFRPQ